MIEAFSGQTTAHLPHEVHLWRVISGFDFPTPSMGIIAMHISGHSPAHFSQPVHFERSRTGSRCFCRSSTNRSPYLSSLRSVGPNIELGPVPVRQLELDGLVYRARRAHLHAEPAEQASADVHAWSLDLAELGVLELLEPHAVVGAYLDAVAATDALLEIERLQPAVGRRKVELLVRVEHRVRLARHEGPDELRHGPHHRPDDPAREGDLLRLSHQNHPRVLNAAAISRLSIARGMRRVHPSLQYLVDPDPRERPAHPREDDEHDVRLDQEPDGVQG